MIKSLQILAITLIGLILIACNYLISTYWSNFEIIPAAIFAYASFISLILLKDKTKLFGKLFEWIWMKLFGSLSKLIMVNILLVVIFLLIFGIGYNQHKMHNYNAYLTIYEKNSADYKIGEQAELFNLITKEKIIVKTDESGRGIFHIDVPSVWQKTYGKYRFPEEKVESTPYGFKIDLSTYKNEAILINDLSDLKNQNIGIYQMPTDYLKRSGNFIKNNKNIASNKFVLAGISDLESFVERDGYIVNYSGLFKVPKCVAYKIFDTQKTFDRVESRFSLDTELNSPSSESYRGSGYDRGHLISPQDMYCHGADAIHLSFLTSVIAPQAPKMNRGVWNNLEKYTRCFASDTVYIIAGTLFLNNDNQGITSFSVIGNDKIGVPSHFYRIISRRINGKIEWLAFIIPNSNDVDEEITKYLVSVKSIEDKTGLTFFTEISSDQQKLKETEPLSVWRK